MPRRYSRKKQTRNKRKYSRKTNRNKNRKKTNKRYLGGMEGGVGEQVPKLIFAIEAEKLEESEKAGTNILFLNRELRSERCSTADESADSSTVTSRIAGYSSEGKSARKKLSGAVMGGSTTHELARAISWKYDDIFEVTIYETPPSTLDYINKKFLNIGNNGNYCMSIKGRTMKGELSVTSFYMNETNTGTAIEELSREQFFHSLLSVEGDDEIEYYEHENETLKRSIDTYKDELSRTEQLYDEQREELERMQQLYADKKSELTKVLSDITGDLSKVSEQASQFKIPADS